jgi:feruloyl esterase
MKLRSIRARRGRASVAIAAGILLALLGARVRVFAAPSCENLARVAMPGARITRTEIVAAGAAPFNASRAFCRVLLTMTPTSDSDIKVEVWLPVAGWNGKFLAVGNGDAAGVISYEAMTDALLRGYATSSTDTGHVGNSMEFALGHREKYVDFGYRSLHEMTLKAKAIIHEFYGGPARRSYWNGCSQGGRQGVTEAARYPSDYDAIIAGATPIDYMQLDAARMALNVFVHRSADSYIPPEKYPAIHRAALKACDALDGVKDGLIADPTACHFDPRVLECKTDDGPSCLTPAQVETARGMYTSIKDPSTGRVVSPALLEPGSELGWARLAGPEPLRNAMEPFKYVVFNDPKWDWHLFNLAADLPRALQADSSIINFTDPNLEQFFDRGGKLLMYHGWADPQVTPLNSISYFNDVLRTTGESSRGKSIQLYMEPGMNHCWGGEGPDTFDVVDVLEQWVQTGTAPARIIASHSTESVVDRTRPLCPYPQVATYTGTGSIDSAENFRCGLMHRKQQGAGGAPDRSDGRQPEARAGSVGRHRQEPTRALLSHHRHWTAPTRHGRRRLRRSLPLSGIISADITACTCPASQGRPEGPRAGTAVAIRLS